MGTLFGYSIIGKSVGDWSQTCAELQLQGVLSFGFLVDTASEPLPKRFGRQALGHAKRTSTINGPDMSSPGRNQRRPKQKEIKLMKTRFKISTTILSVLACFVGLPEIKGSSASCSAAGWVLPRIHNSRRLPRPSKPYHRHWKHRSWLAFALFSRCRQLQHRCWRWNAGPQYC